MSLFQPRLSLKVTQKQILTPGLVQMVSVLALNKLELRDLITQEMVENPVLEELSEAELGDSEQESPSSVEELAAAEERRLELGEREVLETNGHDPFGEIDFGSFFQDYLDPGYKSPAAEVIEKPSFENFLASPTTLTDHLRWQVSLSAAPEAIAATAESVIGNLNEDGFLTATLEEITQSGGHSLDEVTEALQLVQECDPAGVAARDLRECLLIQLRGLRLEGRLAWQIVHDHLSLLQNKHWKELARLLNRPLPEIDAAVAVIRKLDPRPGQRYNKTAPRLIEPDIFFVKVGDDYQVLFNEDGLPQLRMNSSYRRLLERGASTKETRDYVRDRYNSAIQLIKNIEQRKQTIARVCDCIISQQKDFLSYGPDHLKPLMIKEVAEEVGVHPSTVSRAVANKYAHTPQGVCELRSFFSEAVSGPSGGATSLPVLKRRVKKLIEEENSTRPLTDERITKVLQSEGILVTRRTVAKYREDMRIPSTHRRRVKPS